MTTDIRDSLFIASGIVEPIAHGSIRIVNTLGILLQYGQSTWSRSKRTNMNVDEQVKLWIDIIADLATAHDKDIRDRADYESDTMLGPILIAPISQLREFATKLAKNLADDIRIPWFVHKTFENYVESIILKSNDSDIIILRKELAQEVAEMIEKELKIDDITVAITNALMWRNSGDLEKVKDAMVKGGKPRIVGRQSCLFIEVGDALVML